MSTNEQKLRKALEYSADDYAYLLTITKDKDGLHGWLLARLANTRLAISQPPAPELPSVERFLDSAMQLLREVSNNYTRDDDLPDDLLPRIDAFFQEVEDIDLPIATLTASPAAPEGEGTRHPVEKLMDGVYPYPDEPQAQGEPEVVAWMSPGKEQLQFARKDTVYGSHTLPLITLQSNREAISEKDAALVACVEALEWLIEQGGGPACEHEAGVCFCRENAAITQAKKAIGGKEVMA